MNRTEPGSFRRCPEAGSVRFCMRSQNIGVSSIRMGFRWYIKMQNEEC